MVSDLRTREYVLIIFLLVPLSGDHSRNIVLSFGTQHAKTCGQSGEGSEKGSRDGQRSGKPTVWGKAARSWFVQPWKKKV